MKAEDMKITGSPMRDKKGRKMWALRLSEEEWDMMNVLAEIDSTSMSNVFRVSLKLYYDIRMEDIGVSK